MALDIVAQDIIIDETTGLQDDDVDSSLPPHSTNATLTYLLGLDGAGGLTSPEVAFQANFVVASANAGETITSIILAQNSSGTAFSTTVGVNSFIKTVDGSYVWLFQDPTHPNVVIGVIGTSDPSAAPAATGPLALSFGLNSTSATTADLYLVQYVSLLHPNAANPDDQIDLTNKVFASVTGTTVLNFSSLGDAPPGHNKWYILDADTASPQKILVTAHDNGVQAEVNVSTQGLGVSSQDVRFGRELQIDLINGGTQSAGKTFTDTPTVAPDYNTHIETVSGAGFSISQSTPTNTKADIEIHAYNEAGNEEGAAFPSDALGTEINITGVTFKLNGVTMTAAQLGITVDLTSTGAILQDVGEGVTVDFTTAGGVGGTFDRFTIKNIDTDKDYFDVKEVHFAGNVANAYNEEVGSFINFDDDGPSISSTGTEPTLTVDETVLGTNDVQSFAANFSSAFGSDGAGTVTYALGFTAGVTGIVDTLTGQAVVLSLNGGVIEGRTVTSNDLVFTVAVSGTGSVTLDQIRAVVHPTADPDESTSLAADNLVKLTATVTDRDGDHQSATLDIGQNLFFKDDGPSISANGTPPTLTVDETNFGTDDGPTSFAGIFTPHSGGADGAASPVEITYALAASGASGLTDTLTGLSVDLSVDANGVVLGTITGGIEVFRISIDGDGLVTFNQSRAVLHANAADPNDTRTLTSASLIQLTATITDGDGDTAQATANIGTSFVFTDDGPAITAPFDGDPALGIQRETLHNLVSPPALAATGVFGYSIGNDIPDYDGADNIAGNSDDKSDFVDGNLNVAGVQLSLSGFVGSATPPITGSNGTAIFANVNNVPAAPAYATLVSEDANSATFNFTFHYDKDPITAGIQDATAGGQLIFDKVNDTYSIALNDVIDGFAFDVVHTSQDFARNPNTNSGHPEVVVAQLTPNGDPNPFLVQFTANNSPFSFSQNGEGSTADIAFNGANHDMATSAVTTWVSATQGENGVAGDTIQKGELLTIRFFKEPAVLNDPNPGVDVDPVTPGIQHERTEPTTTASGIVLKFDGIGNAEDLVLILDLVDTKGTTSTSDDTETTVALNIQNSDFLKGGAVVPAPYDAEFSLSGYSGSNNDALIIIEQNDYTTNANVLIQGVQIMQSANGLTGTGINFVNTTGPGGGSLAGAQQVLDPTDNDVLKIVDIGFVQSTSGTLNASLDFAVQLADADGDVTPTPAAHILVDVVA
ncbi:MULTISPECIES: DUF5801 repeats-in-toxin domain-containing protein [unclassified Mesorhizobium]|uniref:DUF5801 repeats-in-toxin domain-containing protein n=2 Tax=Mesorhizobium TaxID=68287 RepID=UPI000FCA53FE|nr:MULTISPECIES: DUF5801 repeats-in-toxin domain-containing protein [unclassified Mesorhizobium]RUT90783.1 hypothetical protein EOD15_17430 [Mesorhizobium sp. M7A.T.Ca.US.000.02.2.1]RUU00927.1 hypothetical protein EOD12_17635 [Mesorhizobium sp. M7A.T.Ca.TU.009.02.1.1]RUU90463.1 hypothetical protein EOD03_01455 [Mesorhizobium sp. M7A.T.Ca.TU.009.01.1.2]